MSGKEAASHGPIRVVWPLAVGKRVQLDAAAAAGLRFRQVNVSESFTLQDGEGRYFRASLQSIGSKGAEALVYEAMERSPESPIAIALFCAVLARQRMLLVAQKATELGVSRVVPLVTERSVQPEGLEHEKMHAWPKQAMRASRQCRRAVVPVVTAAVPLSEALAAPEWTGADARYYLDHGAAGDARLTRGARRVCLATGPEGGWSEAEAEALQAAGAQPLRFGGRVLRAETAVIAGLAILQHRLGDLSL